MSDRAGCFPFSAESIAVRVNIRGLYRGLHKHIAFGIIEDVFIPRPDQIHECRERTSNKVKSRLVPARLFHAPSFFAYDVKQAVVNDDKKG